MPKFRDYPDAKTLTGQEYLILSQNTGVSNTVSTVKVNLDVMFMNRFRTLYGQMNVVLAGVTARMDSLQSKVDSITVSSNGSSTYVAFDPGYLESNIASVRTSITSLQNNYIALSNTVSVITGTTIPGLQLAINNFGSSISDLQSNVNFVIAQSANTVTVKNSAPKNMYRFSGALSITGLLNVGKQVRTLPVTGVKTGDVVVVTPISAIPSAFLIGEAFVSANDVLSVSIYVGAMVTLGTTVTANLDVVVLR